MRGGFSLQVSIVSQEPILFADSIMHNIAFGMPGGSGSVSLAMVMPFLMYPGLVLKNLIIGNKSQAPTKSSLIPNDSSNLHELQLIAFKTSSVMMSLGKDEVHDSWYEGQHTLLHTVMYMTCSTCICFM